MSFRVRDLTLALFSAFLGSVKGLLVSQVKSLGAIQIFGIRSFGAICFILPIIVFWNYQLWYDFRCNWILLLRSVVGNVAVCGYYFGFVYLPIAEASLLFYSTPIFTVMIGYVFLKEKLGVSEIVSILLSLLGVALVCVPDFNLDVDRDSNGVVKGVAGSLVGAIAQAAALVIIRKITHVPPAVVSFWWAIIGVGVSSVFSSVQWEFEPWHCGLEVACIVLIAVLGFISELCLVAALKSTNATLVSIALTSEIVWAFVLQIYVNQETPNLMCMLGGLAIVLSVLFPPLLSLKYQKNRRQFDLEQTQNAANNNYNTFLNESFRTQNEQSVKW